MMALWSSDDPARRSACEDREDQELTSTSAPEGVGRTRRRRPGHHPDRVAHTKPERSAFDDQARGGPNEAPLPRARARRGWRSAAAAV